MDDIFKWNWKASSYSPHFFWFEVHETEGFGYYMSNAPEGFQPWTMKAAKDGNFYKFTLREPIYGPQLSEIPPLILKIRMMTDRHERYLERKCHV